MANMVCDYSLDVNLDGKVTVQAKKDPLTKMIETARNKAHLERTPACRFAVVSR